MSLQPLISRIAQHLATQRAQAVLSYLGAATNRCRYRVGGKMCAVGCLIPDELYSEDIEGAAAGDFFDGPPDNQLKAHFCGIAPDASAAHVQTALEIAQLFHDGLCTRQSLLATTSDDMHLQCKRRERAAGSQLFDWEVLTEDYPKLLVVYKDSSNEDFAQELTRRLTYVVGVAIGEV